MSRISRSLHKVHKNSLTQQSLRFQEKLYYESPVRLTSGYFWCFFRWSFFAHSLSSSVFQVVLGRFWIFRRGSFSRTHCRLGWSWGRLVRDCCCARFIFRITCPSRFTARRFVSRA